MIFQIVKNAPIAGKSLGSDYMGEIIIYTLPTCPICSMIKKKLEEKDLYYTEKPFEELPDYIQAETDRAPVLYNGDIYMYSPKGMVDWIEAM